MDHSQEQVQRELERKDEEEAERLAEVARNPKTSSSLLLSSPELSDTKVYESQKRALRAEKKKTTF